MALQISELLLTSTNTSRIAGVLLGERVAAHGKKSLWEDRFGGIVDTVVIHYISAGLVQPDAPFDLHRIIPIFIELGVSSHYLVSREGEIIRLVPDDKKAWHCGGSIMPPPDCRRGVNDFSLGIELVATHDSGFTEAQYTSLLSLCRDLEIRHKRCFAYVGHEHVAGEEAVRLGLRKEPKVDPGPLFDWERLRKGLARGMDAL